MTLQPVTSKSTIRALLPIKEIVTNEIASTGLHILEALGVGLQGVLIECLRIAIVTKGNFQPEMFQSFVATDHVRQAYKLRCAIIQVQLTEEEVVNWWRQMVASIYFNQQYNFIQIANMVCAKGSVSDPIITAPFMAGIDDSVIIDFDVDFLPF